MTTTAPQPTTPTTPAAPLGELRAVPLGQLIDPAPRGAHQVDPRPLYEIGAGHRRYRAAKLAGMPSLMAVVRDLDDVAFLELLTIENKQRDDVEPLDEAAGFKLLMAKAGYDVVKLANRIGLSKEYVYGRLKLLNLIPALKQYLEEKVITAGHGVLLARLTPSAQKRVMGDPKRINRYGYRDGTGLFQSEFADHDPAQPGLELRQPVKARSVRELATYINDHVRFKPEDNDLPNLFPAAAAALKDAEADDLKPVYITYDHVLRDDAKDHKVRTYGVVSWRRADGKQKSKTCAWSRIGIVAAGRDRGDAFRVCVNRDKCDVHFHASARAAKRRAKAQKEGTAPRDTDRQRWAREDAAREAQRARDEAELARWNKALPTLQREAAKKIRTAPTTASSPLGAAILAHITRPYSVTKAVEDLVPVGRTAEGIIRRCYWLLLLGELNRWSAPSAEEDLKALGIDTKQIVDRLAPKPTSAAKAAAGKKGKGTKA